MNTDGNAGDRDARIKAAVARFIAQLQTLSPDARKIAMAMVLAQLRKAQ